MQRLATVGLLLAPIVFVRFANAGDFRFDTVHSQIFACASHMGFSTPCGLMHVKNGYFSFDNGDWNKAAVDVVIDVNSLDMGDTKWNSMLRSWQFLDTGDHPTAHYVSSNVRKTGDRQGVVHGKLTLRGVTRSVDLHLTFNRAGADPYTFRYTAGFSATATLKRSGFGMKKYLPDIGDEVSIRIEAEGVRDSDARKHALDARH